MLALDHLAVSCETLEEGQSHVEAALGTKMVPGGKHSDFGTHNRLLGLEDGLYLEVIAIDPDARAPGRPRWFDLDNFDGAPRLTNWVCRTGNMAETLKAAPEGTGAPVSLSRGDLMWQMAVPQHGRLPFDGMFPALIKWDGAAHPADRLPATGVRLSRLVLHHPRADALRVVLAPLLNDSRVVLENAEEPGLLAEFQTPSGIRMLT